MKAFVIKNNEGKYFTNTYAWVTQICHAYIDDSKESIEKLIEDCHYILGNCKPVEITIAEGDLIDTQNIFVNGRFCGKQYIMNLEKENERLKEQLAQIRKQIEQGGV